MKRVIVTGAAGFIGSRLSSALLDRGVDVLAIDSFTAYYDPALKKRNLGRLIGRDGFELRDLDLVDADLDALLDGVDTVFHLAGQPGVRASFADGFDAYVRGNVTLTQRLLEAMTRSAPEARIVYSSSSSVYGDAPNRTLSETSQLRPRSPYGVTKLAAEQLCAVYADNFGIHSISLRYFTVYGAHQRPDMALNRIIAAGLGGPAFTMFGDGSQIRDFTHVSDVVQANILAMDADISPGTVVNIAGGSTCSLAELIAMAQSEVGNLITVERHAAAHGDVTRTDADTLAARSLLGWEPLVALQAGIAEQVAWQRSEWLG